MAKRVSPVAQSPQALFGTNLGTTGSRRLMRCARRPENGRGSGLMAGGRRHGPGNGRRHVVGILRTGLGAVLSAAAATCLAAGCTGSATINFVSLHATEIDPPKTNIWRYDVRECYWWVDPDGEVNIAMKCRQQHLLLGKYGRVDLATSFVLGEPPAGSGRNYPVRRRETRTLVVSALHSLRLTSQQGIVAVTVEDDGTLRGSFRIWMASKPGLQLFSFLPRRPGRLLCFGTFHAVEDPKRGQAIRAHCESSGWARSARKTTSGPT